MVRSRKHEYADVTRRDAFLSHAITPAGLESSKVGDGLGTGVLGNTTYTHPPRHTTDEVTVYHRHPVARAIYQLEDINISQVGKDDTED